MSAQPIPFRKEETLHSLALAWRVAKRAEDEAREQRLAIEQQICAQLPGDGPECTRTEKLPDLKLSVSYGLTRSVDSEALREAWNTLASDAQECFRWRAEIAIANFRKFKGDPSELAPFVTTKPSKPAVKCEAL